MTAIEERTGAHFAWEAGFPLTWLIGALLAALSADAGATAGQQPGSAAKPAPLVRHCPTLVRFVAISACPLVEIALRPLPRSGRIAGDRGTGLVADREEAY